MSTSRVLRFSRTDDPAAYVLVHVATTGPKPLDLSLSATEGESPYTAVVQQSNLKNLRSKNYQGSEHEWEVIISYILGEPIPTDEETSIAGIEATASIAGSEEEEEKEIVLVIRKRIQSITQRLGTLILKQDDEQAIELFEWTGIAAAKAIQLQSQVTVLADRSNGFEEKIKQLTEQLEELTRAKVEHENQLVANFVQILNEKKLKVRNQQRQLAMASADSAGVAEIYTKTGSAHEASHEIHSLKRHADTDSDSDEEFEEMDVDKKLPDSTNDQETDDGGQDTPDHSEDEEEEDEPKDNDNEMNNNTGESIEVGQRPSPKDHSPPPRRELPFARRGQSEKLRSPVAGNNDETDGESDDDEL